MLKENENDAYHYTPFEKSFKYLSKKKSKTFNMRSTRIKFGKMFFAKTGK